MAGKTKEMSKIKQMLQLHLDGVSNRKIATQLEMNKETVNRYVKQAESDSMNLSGLLKLDDPVLEHRMSGGSPTYTDERFENFKEKPPYLKKEEGRKHVTLKLLWEEYKAENPERYSLTQFRFHCRQDNLANGQKPSTVLKDTFVGGEKIFIDFAGDTMEYTDMDTGEIVTVQMFVACMLATDYGYALGVPSQRSEDLAYAIASCFRSIGGVPQIIVPDNLKSAVIKTDPYEPEINRIMDDLANHYGCVVLPARPVHPKDKSLVEDHVKLVYQQVYAPLRNERFYSLEELNRAAFSDGLQPLLQSEQDQRKKNRNAWLIKDARFRYQVYIGDLTLDAARGVERDRIMRLATCEYIMKGVPVTITGASGTGKSWLGTALGYQACLSGYKVAYFNMQKLFEHITMARIESSLPKFFDRMAQTDLLILDDFGMNVLDGQQLLDFMEIIEDRHARKSTIMISQLPVADWYDVMKKIPPLQMPFWIELCIRPNVLSF
ncbi:MAG: IS21 family transposase [Bacteroidales bacterium]|nr:IS21 family transposase [Bacteroidales bacterium]